MAKFVFFVSAFTNTNVAVNPDAVSKIVESREYTAIYFVGDSNLRQMVCVTSSYDDTVRRLYEEPQSLWGVK